jgi:hypothetical protein
MNGNERTEIVGLTKTISEFQIAVTKVIVPREEIDRRETNLRDRISSSENRAMRWAVSLGVLNLGGYGHPDCFAVGRFQ